MGEQIVAEGVEANWLRYPNGMFCQTLKIENMCARCSTLYQCSLLLCTTENTDSTEATFWFQFQYSTVQVPIGCNCLDEVN